MLPWCDSSVGALLQSIVYSLAPAMGFTVTRFNRSTAFFLSLRFD